jgi:hypothetical protein
LAGFHEIEERSQACARHVGERGHAAFPVVDQINDRRVRQTFIDINERGKCWW